ncbi:DNA recombination protein RmuC [Pontimonas sp.]|uniref:DNA recombination protein RmuC n=1 Tax=Pontimonas sp. TaxID=2304492 RepID=UPI002870226B|nr:DNA recombination protein RmuC [Pontimonas sp.]MDR9396219.1 DNA recombination protein RmuC [Pontimonas sp.]MDR9434696.1 DNA recombination protein RmuC [Pontimonas sp.]
MEFLGLWITAALVLGVAAGFGLAGYFRRSQLSSLNSQLHSEQERSQALIAQLELLQNQYDQLREKNTEDQKLIHMLEPLRDQLTKVDRAVTEMERVRSEQASTLSEQLRQVVHNDEQLRRTTESLETALRGGQTRGRWGEVQLRRIAESAGLLNKLDFVEQKQVEGEGLGKPDMTLRLPGDKYIAIDSKVPFSAYWDAQEIPPSATGDELRRRTALLDDHVKSVRSHVESLSKKSYWNNLTNSPEFVICFIPTEALLSAALEGDPDLMEWSFSKRVALASPVSVWSVMKTVAFAWQQDALTQDAKTLFEVGRELHQRLGTMAERIDKLGRSIRGAVKDYNAFVGTLESRVIPSARKLSVLGDGDGMPEQLPGIDEPVRDMSASELTSALDVDETDVNETDVDTSSGDETSGDDPAELSAK